MILAADAGGTFLKSALSGADGILVPLPEIPSRSDGSAEEIEAAFRLLVRTAEEAAGRSVDGIALSIPGPFDYRTGEFRMDHKFQSVKGRSVREFLPDVPVVMVHDANAFLMGVPGSDRGRVGGITLGTGLGSAVSVDGVCGNTEAMTPLHPLWSRPFRGGIAEDRISARALLKSFPGAKTVEEMAGLSETEDIWRRFGRDLAELLTAWKEEFSLERIVIGGGISRAKDRFLVPELRNLPIEFYIGESASLLGALKNYKNRKTA